MASPSENIRKATTFLLAVFLWLHALLFLNVQSAFISKCTRLLRLTTSEVVLFALLIIFSFLAASGFWKTLGSLAYIYLFPFVLLKHVFYWCFVALRGMNRWFKAQAAPRLGSPVVWQGSAPVAAPALPAGSDRRVTPKEKVAAALRFIVRPFRRFMLLWCILLLATTHIWIVWLCLIVVLFHLARKIFLIIKILFFSDPWLRKVGLTLPTDLNMALAALPSVTRDAAPTNELRGLWNRLKLWRQILDFLKDPYLLSRWAWVLAIVFLVSIYVYVAVLFSFAYYGIARVGGVAYSWPDALVTSMFIPIFASELPKILAIRLLGGIQCLLVVLAGVGTIVNFLRRKLDAIRRAAEDLSGRFADQSIREKYTILEGKFSTTTTAASAAPPTEDAKG